MNTRMTPSLEIRIDRLVDGELSRDEYRTLLLEFDREPGAWRQCALAFLEAQALGGELRGIRATEAQAVTSPAQHDMPERRTTSWAPALRWFTIAASWLLVFGLGTYAARFMVPQAETPRLNVVSNENRALPSRDLRFGAPAPTGMARLEFAGADGRNPQSFDMPIAAPEELERLLASPAPALSPNLVKAIRGAGHEIQPSDRQLVPVVGPNGESMVLPMEAYRFVPVRPTF